MDHDKFSLCERIIGEINQVIQKDRDLLSFELIPVETNQNNKSPVLHVDHNLGLESWCIKYIYEYAHKEVLKYKSNIFHSKQYWDVKEFIKYLNTAVLINPDVGTYWNLRRWLVEKNQLNQTREFNFSALVLSKKPKSSEAFSYRRWLYLFQSSESIDWSIELGLCEECADKNISNYHAWSHRQWVLERATDLLKFEMYKTEKFIRKHVHDYSCYHHRQIVLQNLYYLNYYEVEESNFKEITDLLNVLMKKNVTSQDELISILLPNIKKVDMVDAKLKSFLYCINFAASDIKFTEELNYMYGKSLAFESHRRAMLKFIIETIRLANSTNTITTDCWQPSSKIIKKEYTTNQFLEAIKNLEATRGKQHQRWCKIFLGFNFET
ncbi:protein prenyltransferase alpha subunit repeat-containing protein 1 isoform X2 [Culicoides brevitarsis]|uniref:protein prenyltransferase alpha subunit repeat-containing protein 1 isoform X2 n=1 Tax=Culicoides brevitarsis TaxID=469753 RepID=UPI00307C8CCF